MPENEESGARGRSFWSGTISFGLVSIPVELYPASRSGGMSLRMLDEDGTPLARRYFCSVEDREIGYEEIVRGYEIEKDQFVVVSDDELQALEPRKTREIDLRLFVDAAAVDPVYFERAYFLAPTGGSTKAYRLLAQTMEQTGKAGIATFVMREKEYLVAILSANGILRAETLRFHDEVRTPDDVELPADGKAPDTEVKSLEREIERRIAPGLDPQELIDEYARRMTALVERKREAAEDVVASVAGEAEEAEESVIDLMQLLKQRLAATPAAAKAERAPAAEGEARKEAAPAPTPQKPTSAASTGRKKTSSRPAADDDDALEKESKEQLYERAKRLGIEGRSGMTKTELIRAIRRSA